jgi:hypothetical protein
MYVPDALIIQLIDNIKELNKALSNPKNLKLSDLEKAITFFDTHDIAFL